MFRSEYTNRVGTEYGPEILGSEYRAEYEFAGGMSRGGGGGAVSLLIFYLLKNIFGVF